MPIGSSRKSGGSRDYSSSSGIAVVIKETDNQAATGKKAEVRTEVQAEVPGKGARLVRGV